MKYFLYILFGLKIKLINCCSDRSVPETIRSNCDVAHSNWKWKTYKRWEDIVVRKVSGFVVFIFNNNTNKNIILCCV